MFLLLVIGAAFATNTVCSSATPVTLPQQFDLEFTTDMPTSSFNLNGQLQQAQAFWFSFTPTTTEDVQVSTCLSSTLLDTQLYIFSSCQNGVADTLVADNDDTDGCGIKSVIKQTLTAGTTYLIMVKTKNRYGTVSIAFQSTAPTNTACSSAMSLSSLPVTIEGTTTNTPSAHLTCNGQTHNSPSLWYTFVGDGKYIVADSCQYTPTFDLLITVYEATDDTCQETTCLSSSSEGCPSGAGVSPLSARNYFKTTENRRYYLVVSSSEGQSGTFKLAVRSLSDAVPMICPQALAISSLPYTRSFTIKDNWETTESICIDDTLQLPAAFFSFTGLGSWVYIDTCRSSSGSTSVEVFDVCSNSTCLLHDVTVCGAHAHAQFLAENNVEYHFRVRCAGTPCDVTLIVEFGSSNPHDSCETALPVTGGLRGQVITEALKPAKAGCSGHDELAQGMWFKFFGAPQVQAYKAFEISAYDTNQAVLYDIERHERCGVYVCADNTEEFVTVGIAETAFLFINATGTTYFQYAVVLIESIEHTTCDTAEFVTAPFTTFNYNYHVDPTKDSCIGDFTSPGLWYSLTVPETAFVTLSTCYPSTTIDTTIAVWTGSCATKRCLAREEATESCFGQTELVFEAIPQNTYLIFVGGTTSKGGNFRFTITTTAIHVNSFCYDKTTLALNDKLERFTVDTRNAYETQLKRGDSFVYVRGVFYHIPEGRRGILTAMTCASTTEIPTIIVQTDQCGAMLGGKTSVLGEILRTADYTEGRCGDYGAFLTFALDGTASDLFFGGYFPHTAGFVDVEVYFSSDPEPPSSSGSTSPPFPPPPPPASESSASSSVAPVPPPHDGGLDGLTIAIIVIAVIVVLVFIALAVVAVAGFLYFQYVKSKTYAQIPESTIN